MLIVYDSMTGNVEKFIKKVGMKAVNIQSDLIVDEPYVLVTYTIKFGEVPQSVENFLKYNQQHMVGVASSGNRGWGIDMFAKAADTISNKYNVPIIHKFELAGQKKDIEIFKERVLLIEST